MQVSNTRYVGAFLVSMELTVPAELTALVELAELMVLAVPAAPVEPLVHEAHRALRALPDPLEQVVPVHQVLAVHEAPAVLLEPRVWTVLAVPAAPVELVVPPA